MYKSNLEYHEDVDWVSNSMLRVFESNPRKYYEKYVARTAVRKPPSDAFRLGSAIHLMCLEAELSHSGIVVKPQFNLRKVSDREDNAVFMLQHKNKIILTEEELERATCASNAILTGKYSAPFFECLGVAERSHRWTDVETGLQCKCKPDLEVDDVGIMHSLIDIKSTENPTDPAFYKSAKKYNYFEQADFYLQGRPEAKEFYFIAVRSSEPYEVCVYKVSDENLYTARKRNVAAMHGLADRLKTGDWSHPSEQGIQIL